MRKTHRENVERGLEESKDENNIRFNHTQS